MKLPNGIGRSELLVSIVALVIASLFVLGHLVQNDMNPTIFLAVGEDAGEIRTYAEQQLGDLILRPQLGHDGRFFFVQANDPWIRDPANHAEILDRPIYRSQRMAYPAIAGLGGLLPPSLVVWGMILTNVIAIAVGTFAVASLATQMGGSAWWGLAFPLNIGILSEFVVGGAGVVAAAAAFAAVLALIRGHLFVGSLLFGLSALARESMLVVVFGCVLFLFLRRDRSSALRVAVPSLLLVGGWHLYLRSVLPAEAYDTSDIGLPFVGFLQNLSNWWANPLELAVGVVITMILVLYAIRSLKYRTLTSWAFLPFVPLAFLLAEQVWDGFFNISRAVAPVLTAYVLVTFGQPSEQSLQSLDQNIAEKRKHLL
jgi:hypothetical protein